MEKFIVYVHTCPNGKRYVGMTERTLEERSGRNGNGYHNQPLFFDAIKEYGWDNITHEVLVDNINLEDAKSWEQYYIKKFSSNNVEFGYNTTSGGDYRPGGWNHTEETRKIQSELKKGKPIYKMRGENNPNYGKPLPETRKRKISLSSKGIFWWNNGDVEVKSVECPDGFVRGRLINEETKDKFGNANKGKKHSEESRKKTSKSMKGRHWYTNGDTELKAFECPEGFTPGRLKRA